MGKTRKERIDKWLKSLPEPWEIVRYRDGLNTSVLGHHAVEEFPTANGPADNARRKCFAQIHQDSDHLNLLAEGALHAS